jgi:hypothetical protein
MPFGENDEYRINSSQLVLRKDSKKSPAQVLDENNLSGTVFETLRTESQTLGGKVVAVKVFRISAREMSAQELSAAKIKKAQEEKFAADRKAAEDRAAAEQAKAAVASAPPPPPPATVGNAGSTQQAGNPASVNTSHHKA